MYCIQTKVTPRQNVHYNLFALILLRSQQQQQQQQQTEREDDAN